MSYQPTAVWQSGAPAMSMYQNPSSTNTIAAGAPFLIGGALVIPHVDIYGGELGAVSWGDALYNCLTNAGTYADGSNIYWDNTAKLFVSTAAGNTKVGVVQGNGASVVVPAGGGYMLCAIDLQYHGT